MRHRITHETEPVVDGVVNSLMVHPSVGIEFLVVLCRAIELRPYRNHEASVHVMDTVEHCLWVRITALLKLMASP